MSVWFDRTKSPCPRVCHERQTLGRYSIDNIYFFVCVNDRCTPEIDRSNFVKWEPTNHETLHYVFDIEAFYAQPKVSYYIGNEFLFYTFLSCMPAKCRRPTNKCVARHKWREKGKNIKSKNRFNIYLLRPRAMPCYCLCTFGQFCVDIIWWLCQRVSTMHILVSIIVVDLSIW